MKNLTCIVCPIGCTLYADDSYGKENISVTGNKCSRGITYAQEEIRLPKRIVTATVKILENPKNKDSSTRRIPVKTSNPCPKEFIKDLLQDIYSLNVSLPVKTGDILIAGWKPKAVSGKTISFSGEKINIVVTRTLT